MQREMETVQADFKGASRTKYGDNVLQLVVANGYIGALIRNAEIEGFLGERYPGNPHPIQIHRSRNFIGS